MRLDLMTEPVKLAGSALTRASIPPSGTSSQADTLILVVAIPCCLASAHKRSLKISTAKLGPRRPNCSFVTVKIVAGNVGACALTFAGFEERVCLFGLGGFKRTAWGRRTGAFSPLRFFGLAISVS